MLFIHSTPKLISDNDICCFGDRKTGLLPVPIIRRSIDSFDKSGNRNSLSTSVNSIAIELTEVDKEFLFPLLSKESIDLLIIGTGSSPVFLSPKQQMSLSEINLGVECMNNTSACSSFNLLLGDLRKVGLLIL